MTQTNLPKPHLSRPAAGAKASLIRELLKLASRPEVISFAGGLPTPLGFPVKELEEAAHKVLAENASHALQYSFTEGEPRLREFIAARETAQGVPTKPEEVQIVSGSQQALDLAARVFLDEGSRVLVENPTYLGALQAFRLAMPAFETLPADAAGLNPAAINASVAGARFAYVMPTFANPTGLTMTEERRALLADKAREYDFWLVEDDPYGELWYDKAPPKSLRAWAPERTLRLGTFSKILAPGLRLGYVCGRRDVLDNFTRLKQSLDLHTSTLTQQIAAEVLTSGLLTEHLPKVRAIYKNQCSVMLEALKEFMPARGDISWTHPLGGMFIWVNLPDTIDTTEFMKTAVAHNVAFVPGEAFYALKPQKNKARLSFVTVPPEKIREGVRIFADLIKKELA